MFETVAGHRIHFRENGEGIPIIFVHGWGGNIDSLTPLSRLFPANKTVLLDLPGFGQSANPAPSWGVPEYARLVAAFMKNRRLEGAIYFGHSFGGALGVYLAATEPSLFSKIILADASFRRTPKETGKGTLANFPQLKKMLLPVRRLAYRLLYPGSDALRHPHLEENFRLILTQDMTPYAGKIKIPALILWGEADKDTPVADAYLLHEKIAGSKLTVFPGMTHGLPLKNPAGVAREMEGFL